MRGLRVDVLMPDAVRDRNSQPDDASPAGTGGDRVGRRGDGQSFPMELGLRRVHIDERSHLVAAVTDLTARRRMEDELAVEREGLAHLSRVTMLGELSGPLAHELNQPLAAILSNAQAAQRILRRDPSDVHEVQEILADIVENDRRAGHVISRLRSLLRKEAREHVRLNLNDVVQECMRLMRNDLLNRRVECRVVLAPGLPRCRGDRIQLQQVLLNLIINACDALPAVGERTVVVRTTASELGVRTQVEDTGHGIAPDMMERIFVPFETTKATGMGMGLAVCRTIIHAHGGRIWAENTAIGRRARELRPPPPATAHARSQAMKPIVHVVDDDPCVLKALGRLLATDGFDVALSGSKPTHSSSATTPKPPAASCSTWRCRA